MTGMITAMLLMGLFWIVLLVGVGILLYALVTRWQGGQGRPLSGRDDPLALLRIRYARGEITREQYQEMYRELTQKGVGEP
jgi:putative membrane protein